MNTDEASATQNTEPGIAEADEAERNRTNRAGNHRDSKDTKLERMPETRGDAERINVVCCAAFQTRLLATAKPLQTDAERPASAFPRGAWERVNDGRPKNLDFSAFRLRQSLPAFLLAASGVFSPIIESATNLAESLGVPGTRRDLCCPMSLRSKRGLALKCEWATCPFAHGTRPPKPEPDVPLTSEPPCDS